MHACSLRATSTQCVRSRAHALRHFVQPQQHPAVKNARCPGLQEYRRAAFVLLGVRGPKALFLRNYALYLAGEKRKEWVMMRAPCPMAVPSCIPHLPHAKGAGGKQASAGVRAPRAPVPRTQHKCNTQRRVPVRREERAELGGTGASPPLPGRTALELGSGPAPTAMNQVLLGGAHTELTGWLGLWTGALTAAPGAAHACADACLADPQACIAMRCLHQELDTIEAELQASVDAGSADAFCTYLLGVVLLDK